MDDIIREGDVFNAKFDDGTHYENRVCKKDEKWNDFVNCLSKTKVYTKVSQASTYQSKLLLADVSNSLLELDGKTMPVTFHVSKFEPKINID